MTVVTYEASTASLYAKADLCEDDATAICEFLTAHTKKRKGRKRGQEDILDL